ncbi:MAG: hypothetical protein KZQ70_12190 [gamma proteobacterium symbiont of Lucinoma myriamae]|nr:hypothetical protein [gamma proteobacterium symbiont of Lucinoma myriamae]MCU7818733.1 hypothetical protein [gamma proteobacterium symbiont of Lucinoma myriamae]
MNQTPCTVANSILETDLNVALQQNKLDKIKIMETEEGFYIIVRLK